MLDTLVGHTHWFGSGSRIVVVTKDRHFLRAHGIDCVYEVGLPTENLALESSQLKSQILLDIFLWVSKLWVRTCGEGTRSLGSCTVFEKALTGKSRKH